MLLRNKYSICNHGKQYFTQSVLLQQTQVPLACVCQASANVVAFVRENQQVRKGVFKPNHLPAFPQPLICLKRKTQVVNPMALHNIYFHSQMWHWSVCVGSNGGCWTPTVNSCLQLLANVLLTCSIHQGFPTLSLKKTKNHQHDSWAANHATANQIQMQQTKL